MEIKVGYYVIYIDKNEIKEISQISKNYVKFNGDKPYSVIKPLSSIRIIEFNDIDFDKIENIKLHREFVSFIANLDDKQSANDEYNITNFIEYLNKKNKKSLIKILINQYYSQIKSQRPSIKKI